MSPRREPTWIDRLVVDAMQLEQLREHGGLAGVRDENALESALNRPRHRWHYEPEVDLPALGAAYGWGLARNHPFRDGNKRIAFLTMIVFLELNGLRLEAEEEDVVTLMLSVAEGTCAEDALADWLRERLVRV
ncbi:MAG: type II toxin-antitoxin system death-on-curing family toxin [Candidatus Binatia bacterium]